MEAIKISFPEKWDRFFLISITRRGGSEVQFAAIVDPSSLSIKYPEAGAKSMANAAGGHTWEDEAETDGEISFDIFPIELDTTSGVGLFQQYVGVAGGEGSAYDTSEPLNTDVDGWDAGVSKGRDQFRIAILNTLDPAATTAAGATAASTDSLRRAFYNCKFTGFEESNESGIKNKATFKFKPWGKDGTKRNFEIQSGDQTALGALSTYNTSNYPN